MKKKANTSSDTYTFTVPNRVNITWTDSSTNYGWRKSNEVDCHTLIRSLGFLVSRDKEHTVISTSWDPDCNRFADPLSIPNSAIKSYEELD